MSGCRSMIAGTDLPFRGVVRYVLSDLLYYLNCIECGWEWSEKNQSQTHRITLNAH